MPLFLFIFTIVPPNITQTLCAKACKPYLNATTNPYLYATSFDCHAECTGYGSDDVTIYTAEDVSSPCDRPPEPFCDCMDESGRDLLRGSGSEFPIGIGDTQLNCTTRFKDYCRRETNFILNVEKSRCI